MRVPDADLHGQHLRRRVVLQEVGQVAQRGHQEVGPVAVETQLQEAVALGQRGVSGGARPALQASPHLRTVEAAGRHGAKIAAGCEGGGGDGAGWHLVQACLQLEYTTNLTLKYTRGVIFITV